jgi:hypothetical protein
VNLSRVCGDYFQPQFHGYIPLSSPALTDFQSVGESSRFAETAPVITGRMEAEIILLARALATVRQYYADDSRVFVYIITCEEVGASKVGISAHPEARLKALQTASFGKLHIDAIFRGGRGLEKALHLTLSQCCERRGEWLKRNAAMQEFIRLSQVYDTRNAKPALSKKKRGPLYEWAMRHYYSNGKPREVIEP